MKEQRSTVKASRLLPGKRTKGRIQVTFFDPFSGTGQTLLEYLLLVGIIAAALGVMSPLFKRGIQAVVKMTADQLAVQQEAEQDVQEGEGFLEEARTETQISQETQIREVPGGIAGEVYKDLIETDSTSRTNMGFTNTED
ncbi:MAG: hypothetical protein ABIJ41_03880 [Candidatus Omnitrophota bacterium]